MSNFLKYLFLFITFSLTTNIYAGNITQEVQLKSPLFGGSFVTLEITGIMSDTCTAVEAVRYEPGPVTRSRSIINIFMLVSQAEVACAESSILFSRDIFIGDLDEGEYLVHVYENDDLTFAKDFSVPNDIQSHSLDLNSDQSIGSHSQSDWRSSGKTLLRAGESS